MPADVQSQRPTDRNLEGWFLIAWLFISIWILLCAYLVQGEFGDGYQTIVNSRYFFADSPGYFVQRGPLAAIVLWPVEAVVRAFDIDPLDVRPYHLLSGLLHSAYLWICWLLLRRAPGTTGARLLAFATAILSVVFYAYAPYLSHDILPGLLFLLMIFVCHRWLENPNTIDATYLVALGGAVTLIKQTYAIFWVTIIAYSLIACLLKWDSGRITFRKWSILALLALISAAMSWLGYALFIGGELPDVPLLMRPIELMTAITGQYKQGLESIFPGDLYLRNLHNFGIAAVLMIIPGVVMAFRGSSARLRMVATCWLLSVLAMQLTVFREIRYLAFLAPLTAMLIVPVAQWLLTRKFTAVAIIVIVLFDQTRGLTVAAEQITSAPGTDVARFINAPDGDGNVYVSNILSFVYNASSPLQRDRYHGLYHLTPLLLHRLYEGRMSIAIINDMRELGLMGIDPGDRVYFANFMMVRRPPWQENNLPVDIEEFLLVAGDAEIVHLDFNNGFYERRDNDDSFVMFIPAAEAGQQFPVISRGSVTADTAALLFGDLQGRQQLEVMVVMIKALCQSDACSYR